MVQIVRQIVCDRTLRCAFSIDEEEWQNVQLSTPVEMLMLTVQKSLQAQDGLGSISQGSRWRQECQDQRQCL